MDEATSAYLTTLSPLQIVLNRANNLHPPTYFLALAGWSELAGRSEFSLRFFSVWMSVLLVPLLYRAGRRLFADRRAGFLAAFLAALSPASVVYAQEVRMYALLPAAYLLVLINALPPDGLRSRRDWVWLALSEIVCLYLHFFSIFIVLAINLLLLISLLTRKRAACRSPQFWRRWITSQALVALSYVPWLLAMARWGAEVPGKLSRRDWRASGMGLLGFLRMVWEFLNSGLVGSGKVDLMGRWLSGIAAVTAIALLLAILLDRRRGMLLKTLGGGLLPMLGAYPVWYMRPLAHPRYLLFLGAPLALTLGRTVSVLTREGRARIPAPTIIGVILLVAIVGGDLMALRLALFDERFFRADTRALAAALSERARPGEAALMPPDDYSLWYYDPAPAELVNLPGEIGAEGGRLRLRELGPLLEDRPGAFLVTYRELRDIDPRDQLPFLLEANGRLTERFSVDRMDVARYDLESDWAFPQTEPLEAASGPLTLTGVYTQAVAEADGAVTVALRWRLTKPTEFDYKATVRLWDQGQQLAFDDARLLNELGRPTSYWEIGEEALNTYVLPVPLGTPPLTYTLGLKVYGGPGQSWRGGEEWLALGPVRLLRGVGQSGDPYGSWSGTDWRSIDIDQDGDSEVAPGLVLEGYTTRPKKLKPGDTLYVSLRWRAASDDEDGRHPLAHYAPDLALLRDSGVLARDPGSLFERYPTERWAAGELLIETRELAIPPTLAPLQMALDIEGRTIALEEIAVARDRLRWELPETAQPACARLGDVAELAGYELRIENGELRIENGEKSPGLLRLANLTLYWRGSDEAPADHSYTVFVHLLGPDGELLAQHDGLPQNGERPTTTWLPDEIIADPHNLQPATCNPQLATCNLQLGMYDLATMERLPAYDCEGHRLPNDAIPLPLQESAVEGTP